MRFQTALLLSLWLAPAAISGAQTPKFVLPMSTPYAIPVTGDDFSGDGVPDLVTFNYPGSGLPTVAEVRSGADGSIMHTFTSMPPAYWDSPTRLGDVDGDGIGDFGVLDITPAVYVSGCTGQPNCPLLSPLSNVIRIFHGGTWNESTIVPPAYANSPLSVLAPVGDVNGDALHDIAFGQPGSRSGGSCFGYTYTPLQVISGTLTIVSFPNGQVLRTHVGAPADAWPLQVLPVGDANQDGHDEYVVTGAGRPGFNYATYCGVFGNGSAVFPTVDATVTVYSGQTGAVFSARSFTPSVVHVAPIGDADLDGIPDLAVTVTAVNPVAVGMPPRAGRFLAVWSTVGSAELWSSFMFDSRATSVAAAGQQDGVFGSDLLVTESVFPRPRVRCLSGFDGAERWSIYGRQESPWVVAEPPIYATSSASLSAVLALGDLDTDGKDDFAVIARDASISSIWTTPDPGIYVYTSSTLGVEERLPGCAAAGAPPTMAVRPAGLGFPTVVHGDGAPAYPQPGILFASATGTAQIPVEAGVIGALPCTIDLDPATVFILAPTVSEAQNPLGLRGPPSTQPLPVGIPTSDNFVPGRWYVAFDIPDDPAFVGFTLRLQAGFFGTTGMSFTNSSALTIQDT